LSLLLSDFCEKINTFTKKLTNMTRIKIDGRAISNHWMLLQNDAGQIFARTDISGSYPSPNWYFNGQ